MLLAVLLGLMSLSITHLGTILLVLFVERRPFVAKDQFLTFLIGDIFLAVAVFMGAALGHSEMFFNGWLLVPVLIGVSFGWWQTRFDINRGMYSVAQSWSPSKLWHQFVIYPLVGALVTGAVMSASVDTTAFMLTLIPLLVWTALHFYDAKNPKMPHIDFHWGKQEADASLT